MATNTGNGSVLSSRWGELNDFLIAKFFAVDEKGVRSTTDQTEVHAPLLDANLSMTLNWQSPFESASPDTKLPALISMLQSGMLTAVLADMTDATAGVFKSAAGKAASLESSLEELKGRTGITKLNSTQIFTGMQPVRIPVTAFFRAFSDPYTEVEQPVEQLIEWAAPKKLSADSIVKRASTADDGVKGMLKALLPSEVPQMISMQYKGKTYGPLVIEEIGKPIIAPIAASGYHTELILPMSLASLTALDRDDFKRISSPGST